MGFLESGAPLSWLDSVRYRDVVKQRGIRQFIQLYKQYKSDRTPDAFLSWGDEVEYCLLKLNERSKVAQLYLGAEHTLEELQRRERTQLDKSDYSCKNEACTSRDFFSHKTDTAFPWQTSGWHPEYGTHMVEAIPGKAFPLCLDSILWLLPSMQIRRMKIQAALPSSCYVASVGSFPTMGSLEAQRQSMPVSYKRRCQTSSLNIEREREAVCGETSFTSTEVRNSPVFAHTDFAYPSAAPHSSNGYSRSLFIGDEIINPHPRFVTLTANIRERRGKKVEILIPLLKDKYVTYLDKCTASTSCCCGEYHSKSSGRCSMDSRPEAEAQKSETEYRDMAQMQEVCQRGRRLMLEGKVLHDGNSIYMDAMGFGMGMHCVQATFGCATMRDARYLYDQLAVLAPLWLSLTAATPFMRGLVAATDSRWDTIAACVDCRTNSEKTVVPKSRYDTVSLYISDEPPLRNNLSFYNDVPTPVNVRAYNLLVASGVDQILARHVAFLFNRDPLVIFKDKLLRKHVLSKEEGNDEDNRTSSDALCIDDGKTYATTEDFENLQSTNWNSVRFKPPLEFKSGKSWEGSSARCSLSSPWKVEFRTPDVQLTDFENAACLSLLVVLVQVILEEKSDLYLPMSLNDENKCRAVKRNSILSEKFWWRNDIRNNSPDRSYSEMTLHEIFFGAAANTQFLPTRKSFSVSEKEVPISQTHYSSGLVSVCLQYINRKVCAGLCSRAAAAQYVQYFDFIRLRTQGVLPTDAAFLRACLAIHPAYEKDSVVPGRACYDLCQLAVNLGHGFVKIPELHGPFVDCAGMRITEKNSFDNGVALATKTFLDYASYFGLFPFAQKELTVITSPRWNWPVTAGQCASSAVSENLQFFIGGRVASSLDAVETTYSLRKFFSHGPVDGAVDDAPATSAARPLTRGDLVDTCWPACALVGVTNEESTGLWIFLASSLHSRSTYAGKIGSVNNISLDDESDSNDEFDGHAQSLFPSGEVMAYSRGVLDASA